MFIEKLKSRKFLAALVGVITGLAVIFGLDGEIISTVSGAVMAIGSVVAYIVTEGSVDKAAVSDAITLTGDAIKMLEGDSNAES